MKTRRDRPYIWVTWLTGILAADAQCEWAPWFKAHFQGYEKRVDDNSNLAIWKAEHGEMLRQRADSLSRDGYRVFVEGQNKFNLKGRVATIGGTADIVAIRGDECLVVDCKTGQQKSRDVFQVLLYMMILPLTHSHCAGRTMSGELQYKNGSLQIPAQRLGDDVRDFIRQTVERVAANSALPRIASYSECQWCDIAECPDRITEDVKQIETEMF